MTARARVFVAALLLSAAAFGLWQRQGARKELAQTRREQWMAYLQGPLSDLLYGSTRLRPLLAKKSLSPAEKEAVREALEHLEHSASAAQAASAQFAQDPTMAPLTEAMGLHQVIYALAATWPGKMASPSVQAQGALDDEAMIRGRLWKILAAERETLQADGILNKDEVLEMNALLYSLQEGTGQSAEP
jgi:hypothetical protein